MGFGEAISTVLTKKYADFNGRARRSEYWWYVLFNFVVLIVLDILAVAVGKGIFALLGLYWLATIVPNLAVVIRRLHDTGRPWPWIFISLIPFVGAIILIVFLAQDSQGPNKWGPSPKGGGGYGGYMGGPADPAYPPLPNQYPGQQPPQQYPGQQFGQPQQYPNPGQQPPNPPQPPYPGQ